MTAPALPPEPDLELLESIRGQIERDERGWRRLRSWPTPLRFGVFAVAMVALELLVLFGTPRTDLGAYPVAQLVIAVAGLAVVAAAGARLFLHPVHRRGPSPAKLAAVGVALLLVPVAFALLPPPHDHATLHPESFEGVGADFVRRAVACLIFGVLVALPLTAFAVAADRRPLLGTLRIVLVAGVGGVAGTLGLLLHCPLVSVSHRIVGHGAVGLVVALILAAALLVLRRTRRTPLPA